MIFPDKTDRIESNGEKNRRNRPQKDGDPIFDYVRICPEYAVREGPRKFRRKGHTDKKGIINNKKGL